MLSIASTRVGFEEWENTFRVNVTLNVRPLNMRPYYEGKGKGVIINTGSVAGAHAHHGQLPTVLQSMLSVA